MNFSRVSINSNHSRIYHLLKVVLSSKQSFICSLHLQYILILHFDRVAHSTPLLLHFSPVLVPELCAVVFGFGCHEFLTCLDCLHGWDECSALFYINQFNPVRMRLQPLIPIHRFYILFLCLPHSHTELLCIPFLQITPCLNYFIKCKICLFFANTILNEHHFFRLYASLLSSLREKTGGPGAFFAVGEGTGCIVGEEGAFGGGGEGAGGGELGDGPPDEGSVVCGVREGLPRIPLQLTHRHQRTTRRSPPIPLPRQPIPPISSHKATHSLLPLIPDSPPQRNTLIRLKIE